MKLSNLLGHRYKDVPKDAKLSSHQFLLRGAYARQVGAGLFSMLPLGLRVIQKIEKIIRDEMNELGGQEVLMPVVLPRELWEESGRYESVGPELLRFSDHAGRDLLLAMTHEEAVVHLSRSEIKSYKQLPFMVYQIQTKFRDELRSRGGLIRVREFTMKDAYSYHENEEDLLKTYDALHKGYENIFSKVGLKNFISVESDSGMMGGGGAHEFIELSEDGEDSILCCAKCDYRANREVAETRYTYEDSPLLEMQKVKTPDCKSIADVASYLKVPENKTCKAVFYEVNKKLVLVILRGDLEVSEAKLKRVIQCAELEMASEELIKSLGMEPGYASPVGTDLSTYRLLVDESLRGACGLVTGANEKDYHYTDYSVQRDLDETKVKWVDIASVEDGFACPKCEAQLELKRGIEIGNIFRLGDKYTKKMGMTYLDKNGKAKHPAMGCYGIGVGRLMASIMEEHHDKFGPTWPASVAPFTLHINVLDPKKTGVKDKALEIYESFKKEGIDVLLDDRGEKAGFQFNDADLIGAPHRIILSPKTIEKNSVEYRTRSNRDIELIPLDGLVQEIKNRL